MKKSAHFGWLSFVSLTTFTAVVAATLCPLLSAPARADIAGQLGSSANNGGQIGISPDVFDAIAATGAKVVRVGVRPSQCWNPNALGPNRGAPKATPSIDNAINAAADRGLKVMLLFSWARARDSVDSTEMPAFQAVLAETWQQIGSFYANKYGSKVQFWSAFNEPLAGYLDMTPTEYATALEGFADGVRSKQSSALIMPGGYQEIPIFTSTPSDKKNAYLEAVVPLFNNGKLNVLDIHRYMGSSTSPDKEIVIDGKTRARYSVQTQFDEAKRIYGITKNVRHACTEINANNESGGTQLSDVDANEYFLTAVWSSVGVQGSDDKPANVLTLPYSIHLKASGINPYKYAMSEQFAPWKPALRGATFKSILDRSKGLTIQTSYQCFAGTLVTGAAGGKKLWVWHNRRYWSTSYGTSFTCAGIPNGATRIEVWNGNERIKDVPLNGQSSKTITGLPKDVTLMFLAVGGSSSNSLQAAPASGSGS